MQGINMELSPAPGMHLLIDFWGASNIDEIEYVGYALSQAALACGAAVQSMQLRLSCNHAGVNGVAMLDDSHLGIYTWPEIAFVALDVFLYGNRDPHRAVPVLYKLFKPKAMKVTESARGKMISASEFNSDL